MFSSPQPWTTRTRCLTLAIMPRTCGVSTSVRLRPRLFKPRPIRVASCTGGRRIGLATCTMVMVLACLLIELLRRLHVDLAAPRLQLRNLEAAPRRHGARAILVLERVERGTHHVVGGGRRSEE